MHNTKTDLLIMQNHNYFHVPQKVREKMSFRSSNNTYQHSSTDKFIYNGISQVITGLFTKETLWHPDPYQPFMAHMVLGMKTKQWL